MNKMYPWGKWEQSREFKSFLPTLKFFTFSFIKPFDLTANTKYVMIPSEKELRVSEMCYPHPCGHLDFLNDYS